MTSYLKNFPGTACKTLIFGCSAKFPVRYNLQTFWSRSGHFCSRTIVPAWKVEDRGFEHHSGLPVSKKQYVSSPLTSKKINIVGSLRDWEVACSASVLKFQILCLGGSVISFISPFSEGFPGTVFLGLGSWQYWQCHKGIGFSSWCQQRRHLIPHWVYICRHCWYVQHVQRQVSGESGWTCFSLCSVILDDDQGDDIL